MFIFSTGRNETQVIELPIVDMLSPRPPFLPLAIPKDLSERIIRLHGDPSVWWIGQFMKYLLRYQPQTQAMLDEAKETMNFQKPIVGYISIVSALTYSAYVTNQKKPFTFQCSCPSNRQSRHRSSFSFHWRVHAICGRIFWQIRNETACWRSESLLGFWWSFSFTWSKEKVILLNLK